VTEVVDLKYILWTVQWLCSLYDCEAQLAWNRLFMRTSFQPAIWIDKVYQSHVIFGIQSQFKDYSVRATLQVCVYSGYDTFHKMHLNFASLKARTKQYLSRRRRQEWKLTGQQATSSRI